MHYLQRQKIISVLGGTACTPDIGKIAKAVGMEIARHGAILICGGLTGIMEEACRGAKEGGGLTIGVLPGYEKNAANLYVDIVLPTGMGNARNAIIVSSADAAIAIDGSHGTLSEIGFCLKMGVPLIGIYTFDVDPAIYHTTDPLEAVEKAFLYADRER